MSINIESGFSMKGSLIQKGTLKDVKSLGYEALGLVDNNTAFFLMFYEEMKAQGIKPLLALRSKGKYYDYLIYAKNFKGYKEILYFASSKDKEDIIDGSMLPISKDLIYVFDVTMTTSNNIEIIDEEYESLRKQNLSVYLGVDFQYYPCEIELYPMIKNNYKVAIIDQVKYLKDGDKKASDVLSAILTDGILKEPSIFDIGDQAVLSLKPKDIVLLSYHDYPELIRNTEDLINSVDIEIVYDKALPKYPVPDNVPSYVYLKLLSEKGLEKRLRGTKKDPNIYGKRLDYELSVIHSMGFDDYFLVVYDYILFAKKNGIMVGPGRGSAASSLVSYSLGIVDVDPIEYSLYFERFLNPARKTMPDIDTDFEDTRRDDVVRYVSEKYGAYRVSVISTFQTFLAKSCIRDVSKILNIPDEKANLLSKEVTIDNSTADLLSKKSVINLYEHDNDFKDLIDIAAKIEGLPRSIGTHAAGIIISNNDLREYSEVHIGLNGFLQTVYDSDSLKDVGLLKMDFLALKNLSIIHDILNDIKSSENVDIKLSRINLHDAITYKSLNIDSTTGIFQLESPGMADLLKKMKVNSLSDLALCIALYRPGPMESIPLYLKRRNGQVKVEYYDDSIKDVLTETLGIIVYQEQTMAVVSNYAGLSLADADIIRRAMSAKDPSLMQGIKDKFFEGAKKMNRPLQVTEKLYSDIDKFAGYGFNKSHAVSYALIAYWLAYLKAHYPNEFMANLLKNSPSTKYIKECQAMNIRVMPPDIRYSSYEYNVVNGNIYMPITQIKGIGVSYAKKVEEIAKSGDLTFEEFVSASKGIFPRGLLEELILAGAFDYTNYNKRTMIEALDGLYDFDPSLVKGLNYHVHPVEEYDFEYLKNNEFELLGFNPKYHPLMNYKGNLKKISDVSLGTDGVSIVAYVSDFREVKTKSGDVMASFTIEDQFKAVKAVAFARDYMKFAHFIKANCIYEFLGSYQLDPKGQEQFVVRNVKEINDDR